MTSGQKRGALGRYERDEDGTIIIDVSAPRVEDLYSNFDRSAPYIRRDLDEDLADYLVVCAREVNPAPFIIRFSLTSATDEDSLARIRHSVHNYFIYLRDREAHRIVQMFRRSAILFGIGVGILFLSVSLNQHLGEDRSVIANVFAEGLTVAAWVSLWEALATFLIEWLPYRRNVALYQHLANARLAFVTDGERREAREQTPFLPDPART